MNLSYQELLDFSRESQSQNHKIKIVTGIIQLIFIYEMQSFILQFRNSHHEYNFLNLLLFN